MLKLIVGFSILLTSAFLETNSHNTYFTNIACDSLGFSGFKNNLATVESSDHASHNQRAKMYSHYFCQTASVLCDGLIYSQTVNYICEDYELSMSSYQIPDSVVTDNAFHVNILTIEHNNELIHSEILADVHKGMTLELTGFERVDEKRYIIWGYANPLSKPEFGRIRLDINGAIGLTKYECKEKAP